jgi:hypothetical protein
MKTIWTHPDNAINLVTQEFGETDSSLALRIPHRGVIVVRDLDREDALALAAAIQAHYAEAAQR